VQSIRHGVRAARRRSASGAWRRRCRSPTDIDAIVEAHRLLLGIILDQQLADAEAGVPLSPKVDIARLTKQAREELRAALGSVRSAIDLVAEGRF
jgi:DNA polymerase-3 subunit epsilon/CBS domain-containing protein